LLLISGIPLEKIISSLTVSVICIGSGPLQAFEIAVATTFAADKCQSRTGWVFKTTFRAVLNTCCTRIIDITSGIVSSAFKLKPTQRQAARGGTAVVFWARKIGRTYCGSIRGSLSKDHIYSDYAGPSGKVSWTLGTKLRSLTYS
jgi:hypothetical protein